MRSGRGCSGAWSGLRGQKVGVQKAEMPFGADDDVVEDLNSKELSREEEAPGQDAVLGARSGIATGVVVDQDRCDGAASEEGAKDIGGIGGASATSSLGDLELAKGAVFGVEGKGKEVLDPGFPKAGTEQGGDFAAADQRGRFCDGLGNDPASEFHRGGDPGSLGEGEAGNFGELVKVCIGKEMGLEEPPEGPEGGLGALRSGSENEAEKLFEAQGLGPKALEPFPGKVIEGRGRVDGIGVGHGGRPSSFHAATSGQ